VKIKIQCLGALFQALISKNYTPLCRKAHSKVKILKKIKVREYFLPFFNVEKFMPLWQKAHFELKMYKIRQQQTILGNSAVEKLHAPVAKSAFYSQDV